MRVRQPRKVVRSIVALAGISYSSDVQGRAVGMLSVRCGHTVVIDVRLEKGGLTMEDEGRPSRDIVREAREVIRPPFVCKKIDVLARSNDVSITMTFEPTFDVDARSTASFVRKMTASLQDMGFETKDAPRAFGGGQRAKTQREYIKAICTCNGRMYITGKGDAACEKYSERPDYKHLYIRKGDLDRAM